MQGRPPVVGETWSNPGLANTLKRLVAAERLALARGCTREQGIRAAFDEFYTGAIAQDIASFFQSGRSALKTCWSLLPSRRS